MEEWQKRFINEYIDLRDKVNKARIYIFEHRDKDITLLQLQLNIMIAYLEVLELRGQKYGIDLTDEFQKTVEYRK